MANDLQDFIRSFRSKLQGAVDEAWEDRKEILEGVEMSGGMGLEGGAGLEKARESEKSVLAEWKGLGVLASLV